MVLYFWILDSSTSDKYRFVYRSEALTERVQVKESFNRSLVKECPSSQDCLGVPNSLESDWNLGWRKNTKDRKCTQVNVENPTVINHDTSENI